MSSDGENAVHRFLLQPANQLNKVPPEDDRVPASDGNLSRRIGIAGVAAAADCLLAQGLQHHPSRTATLESAAAVFAGAFIFAGISKLKGLCATAPEQKSKDRFNLTTGGVSGGVAGAGLVKLVAGAIFAPHLALAFGGGILGAGAIGVAGAHLNNYFAKTKYCPHCGEPGRCNQSVCRSCYKLFYPSEEQIDCGRTPYLSWGEVASLLHYWKLSYLDAEVLVEHEIGEWKTYPDSDQNVFLDCETFIRWLSANKSVVISYRKRGEVRRTGARRSRSEIEEYLDDRKL
jgi:hypothetical protein